MTQASRVSAADAEAMSPRLMRGAIVGIDRHYNSLAPFRANEKNIYLVRCRDSFVLRYVEEVGEELVLRAERTSERLVKLEEDIGGIIGRVCWVWAALDADTRQVVAMVAGDRSEELANSWWWNSCT